VISDEMSEEDDEDNNTSNQRFEGGLKIRVNRMPEARRKVDE
jgi:hypothetical protein